MSKRKKTKGITPSTWEAVGHWFSPDGKRNKDTHTIVFESMLRSDAMARLTPRQQMLVVICKAQCFGKRKPRADLTPQEIDRIAEDAGITPAELRHDRVFYLSWDTAKQYPIYRGIKERQVFHRDMQALHRAGFIEILRRGVNKRYKTIYRFSDEWREKTNKDG